ncbi:MAG: hypothetical protein ABI206_02130 [Antricoccus sp.]
MPTVLVVHHTVSPATAEMLDAVMQGLRIDELTGLSVCSRPALSASPADTLAADGVLLLSPVNIGYLSGALKYYFDTVYYPCLEATIALPFGAVLSSGQDASGALRALSTITKGMQWTPVAEPLVISGSPDRATREQIKELASTVGAYASGLITD